MNPLEGLEYLSVRKNENGESFLFYDTPAGSNIERAVSFCIEALGSSKLASEVNVDKPIVLNFNGINLKVFKDTIAYYSVEEYFKKSKERYNEYKNELSSPNVIDKAVDSSSENIFF